MRAEMPAARDEWIRCRSRDSSSRRATYRHVTIIAMTAGVASECREQCIAAGMDEYIPKPIKLEDLIEALEKTTAPRK